MARWNLEKYRRKLDGYCELRGHENQGRIIEILNGELTANSQSIDSGLSARSFHKGAWGFCSAPEISDASVDQVLKEARQNSSFLSERKTSSIGLKKAVVATAHLDLSTRKQKYSANDLITRLKEIDAMIATRYPDLANRYVRMFQQDFVKELVTSEGALTYSHYARSFISVRIGLNSEFGPLEVREIFGGTGQIEDTFKDLSTFEIPIEKAYGHLKNKIRGFRPEGGVKDVILDSKLAGILAHEAVGHTTEADIVLGGSVAANYLEQQVASPLVSLTDFAHTALGTQAPMPVLFDDEGTEASDTVIIQDGILKTFMNSKETAEHFGQEATGHARAWGFNDEPLIRMRNTAILPGKSKLEDMIASIDDGYYLIEDSNGQADSTSEFMFGVPMGYEIKKGKLGRAILDTTISGVAFDLLKSVSMISNDMTWVSFGTCGKKQPMTVGMGGPAIKCRVHIGGK